MGSSSVENFGSPSLCFDFSAPDAPCHPAKITGTNKEKRADKQIRWLGTWSAHSVATCGKG